MTLTAAEMRAMLAALVATGGPFDPAATYVAVFASVDDLGQDTAMSNVTQATAAAATRVAVTAWSDPIKLADGSWCVEGPLCEFAVAGAGDAQTVAGWMYASASTAGVLKAFRTFDDPVNLPDEFHPFQIVPRLVVDPAGRWDASVLIGG